MVPFRRSVNARGPAALIATLLLAGCSYLPPLPERPRNVFTLPVTNRGHLVTEDQLRQLTPGVSTRADAQAALGSPSHAGTFNDENWYYISSVSTQIPANTPRITDRRVTVLAFDRGGVLREVRQVEPGEMRRIAMVSRETPTPGTERSLLQALFGNIGRVGPNLGQQQQTGPGFSAGSASGR
jgi:outer membrane protein assembly factor BamE (lipoprotein component of BamABCDE complex)